MGAKVFTRDDMRRALAAAIAALEREDDPRAPELIAAVRAERDGECDQLKADRLAWQEAANTAHQRLTTALSALAGVVRVADRATVEFHAARAVLADYTDKDGR